MNSLFFSRVTGRENVSHKSPVVAKQDGRIIYRDNKTIHCGLELQNRFGSFELLPSAFSNPPRLGRNDMACATCDVLVRDQSAPSKAQSRHGMRAIFLIHLKQVIRDKDWVYPLFLLLLCTLLGQYFAPTDDDPTLIYSTRTQSVWLCAWGCSIFWVSFVAARIGSMQRQNQLRGFWKSLGVPDLGYFFALFAIPNLRLFLFPHQRGDRGWPDSAKHQICSKRRLQPHSSAIWPPVSRFPAKQAKGRQALRLSHTYSPW
jgi:hypothetical protein